MVITLRSGVEVRVATVVKVKQANSQESLLKAQRIVCWFSQGSLQFTDITCVRVSPPLRVLLSKVYKLECSLW